MFLPLGIREVVTRATCLIHTKGGQILAREVVQGLDQEWSSYVKAIAALQKLGGFAYVRIHIYITTKIHKKNSVKLGVNNNEKVYG